MFRRYFSYILSLLLIFHTNQALSIGGIGSFVSRIIGKKCQHFPDVLDSKTKGLLEGFIHKEGCSESIVEKLAEEVKNDREEVTNFCQKLKYTSSENKCGVSEVTGDDIREFHKNFVNDPRARERQKEKEKKQLLKNVQRFREVSKIQTSFKNDPDLVRALNALLTGKHGNGFKTQIAGILGKKAKDIMPEDLYQCSAGQGNEVFNQEGCEKEEAQEIFSSLKNDCAKNKDIPCGTEGKDGLIDAIEKEIVSKAFPGKDLSGVVGADAIKEFLKRENAFALDYRERQFDFFKNQIDYLESKNARKVNGFLVPLGKPKRRESLTDVDFFSKLTKHYEKNPGDIEEIENEKEYYQTNIILQRLRDFKNKKASKLSSEDIEFEKVAQKFSSLSKKEQEGFREALRKGFKGNKGTTGSDIDGIQVELVIENSQNKKLIEVVEGLFKKSSYVQRVLERTKNGIDDQQIKDLATVPLAFKKFQKNKKISKKELKELEKSLKRDPLLSSIFKLDQGEFDINKVAEIASVLEDSSLYDLENAKETDFTRKLFSVKVEGLLASAHDCNIKIKKNLKKFCARKRGDKAEISIGDAIDQIAALAKSDERKQSAFNQGLAACFIIDSSTPDKSVCDGVVRASGIHGKPSYQAYLDGHYKDRFHAKIEKKDKGLLSEIIPSFWCDKGDDPDHYNSFSEHYFCLDSEKNPNPLCDINKKERVKDIGSRFTVDGSEVDSHISLDKERLISRVEAQKKEECSLDINSTECRDWNDSINKRGEDLADFGVGKGLTKIASVDSSQSLSGGKKSSSAAPFVTEEIERDKGIDEGLTSSQANNTNSRSEGISSQPFFPGATSAQNFSEESFSTNETKSEFDKETAELERRLSELRGESERLKAEVEFAEKNNEKLRHEALSARLADSNSRIKELENRIASEDNIDRSVAPTTSQGGIGQKATSSSIGIGQSGPVIAEQSLVGGGIQAGNAEISNAAPSESAGARVTGTSSGVRRSVASKSGVISFVVEGARAISQVDLEKFDVVTADSRDEAIHKIVEEGSFYVTFIENGQKLVAIFDEKTQEIVISPVEEDGKVENKKLEEPDTVIKKEEDEERRKVIRLEELNRVLDGTGPL